MGTIVKPFLDPADSYTDYTSEIVYCQDPREGSGETKLDGLLQADLGANSTLTIEARLSPDSAWRETDTFTTSMLGLILLAPEIRVKVSGTGRAWVLEVR